MTAITLPPDMEEAFAREAQHVGTTTGAAVLESLRAKLNGQQQYPEPEIEPGAMMLELLEGHVGTVVTSNPAGRGTHQRSPAAVRRAHRR